MLNQMIYILLQMTTNIELEIVTMDSTPYSGSSGGLNDTFEKPKGRSYVVCQTTPKNTWVSQFEI